MQSRDLCVTKFCHVGGGPGNVTTWNNSVIYVSNASMPMFFLIGCSNDKKLCPNLSFCHVPAMIKNEGEAAEILSAERRRLWLAAMSRDDLTEKILKNDSLWSPFCIWKVCKTVGQIPGRLT